VFRRYDGIALHSVTAADEETDNENENDYSKLEMEFDESKRTETDDEETVISDTESEPETRMTNGHAKHGKRPANGSVKHKAKRSRHEPVVASRSKSRVSPQRETRHRSTQGMYRELGTDSEDDYEPELRESVSSRGRVRKLVNKALWG